MIKFKEWLLTRDYSLNTVNSYLIYERRFYDFCSATGEFTQDNIEHFILRYNNCVARAFLKAYMDYIGEPNTFNIPTVRGRKKKSETVHLSKEEIYKLVNNADIRLGSLMLLLFEGGLRITEAIKMRWSDIDLDERKIKVKFAKGRKYREVIFSENTKKILLQYLDHTDEYHLVFKLTRFKAFDLLKEHGENMLSKNVTPHMFRHSCGMYLRKKGWTLEEIQKYLGHEKLETTLIYAAVDKDILLSKMKEVF